MKMPEFALSRATLDDSFSKPLLLIPGCSEAVGASDCCCLSPAQQHFHIPCALGLIQTCLSCLFPSSLPRGQHISVGSDGGVWHGQCYQEAGRNEIPCVHTTGWLWRAPCLSEDRWHLATSWCGVQKCFFLSCLFSKTGTSVVLLLHPQHFSLVSS